jgi:hypothetical protein
MGAATIRPSICSKGKVAFRESSQSKWPIHIGPGGVGGPGLPAASAGISGAHDGTPLS